jgi:hypothetical protein
MYRTQAPLGLLVPLVPLGRGYLLGLLVPLGRVRQWVRGYLSVLGYLRYLLGLLGLSGLLGLLGLWSQTTQKRSRSNLNKYLTKQAL